ncbi:hypothetical protein ACGLHS_12850 [Variovorax sp. VaC1]|uniref:hypothetical protein n=1 Tax=Variovorax sp. VaC1 TaxID=3373132 RepID=UPI003749DFBB
MNSIIPAESRLQLVADSDSEVETYWFQSNGFVRAITGVSDGPVCAPLFRYRFLSEDSIELIGHDGVAGTWTGMRIEGDLLRAERAGKPVAFRIQA